jgi:threonine dehydrogenase-like Zn-dependent dehydrogenase
MKAAFVKDGRAYCKEIDPSPLSAGQIRVRVEACGICGSELACPPEDVGRERPFGHEIAGIVVETAPDVTRVSPGDRVVLDSSSPCGVCDSCKDGRQDLCLDVRSFFHNAPSLGMAEEIIAPGISAISYQNLSPAVACLQEPLGVAIDMVRLADLSTESHVLVMGLGPIGLTAVALARQAGVRRLFVSEPRETRREFARRYGVDGLVDPTKTPLQEYDFGCRIDRVLQTCAPPTLAEAFDVAAVGAVVSFVGIGWGDKAFCRFDVNEFHFKKLQLRASYASPALFGPRALRLLGDGVVDGEACVTHRFKLEKIEQAYRVARDDPDAVKVVVEP